jgi:hypothetical protein
MLPGENLRPRLLTLTEFRDSDAIGLVLAIWDWEVVVVDMLLTRAHAMLGGWGLIIHFWKGCTTFFARCSIEKNEAAKEHGMPVANLQPPIHPPHYLRVNKY